MTECTIHVLAEDGTCCEVCGAPAPADLHLLVDPDDPAMVLVALAAAAAAAAVIERRDGYLALAAMALTTAEGIERERTR